MCAYSIIFRTHISVGIPIMLLWYLLCIIRIQLGYYSISRLPGFTDSMIDAMTSELPFSVSINVPSQSQMMHSGASIGRSTLRLGQEKNASKTNMAQVE